MHIGFLTPEYVTDKNVDGGLANYIKKTAYSLTEKGHNVSVLVVSDKNKSWHDGKINVHEIKGFFYPKFITLLSTLPYFSVYPQVVSSKRLKKLVWKIHCKTPFDILQASSYLAPGYCLLHNGRIPIVCRLSSYTPLWRSAFGRQTTISKHLSDWLEVRQVIDSDGAFAPSNLVASIFKNHEGYEPTVIRTPLDLNVPSDLDSSYYEKNLKDKKYILYFGTLSRIKGIDLLADIIPDILEKNRDLHFVFIGRDDGLPDGQKVFDHISRKNFTYKNNLYYNVAIPKKQLCPIIQHSLGVLMPSRIDNYPNACLEAQSMGIPVIGTYNSSLDEMIVDGKTGFLAQNNSPESIKNAIERLLDLSDQERNRMQGYILKSIEEIKAEDRVEELISFYKQIIINYKK